MHKYFLIPAIIFFLIISLIVIYLQFFYLDWKWDVLSDNFDVKTETYQEKVLDESCDDDGEVILHPIVGVWDVEKIAYQSIDILDNELAGFFHPSHKTLTFTFLEGDELIEDWCYEDEIEICYAKNYKYSIVDEKLDTLKLIQTTFPPEPHT